MKWIGLEWRKGREIGEKSCPKFIFSRKHIKHISPPPTKKTFPGRTKSPAGIPLGFGEGGQGAGPGPRLNSRGQEAGPGPNVNISYYISIIRIILIYKNHICIYHIILVYKNHISIYHIILI